MKISVSDKLLVSALKLHEAGIVPFSAEDLVVSAWMQYPDTFGLRGHLGDDGLPLYPDSNRVLAEIMGSKPVRKRGLIEKVGRKQYRMTAAGEQRARSLASARSGGAGAEPKKAIWSRSFGLEVARILSTKAVDKVRGSADDELSFHDASVFWRISPRSTANELAARLANMEHVVSELREAVANGPVVAKHGASTLDATDVDLIARVHKALLERFEPQLRMLRSRKDERV